MALTDLQVVSISGTVFATSSPNADHELPSPYRPKVTL